MQRRIYSGQCWNGGGGSNKGDSTVMKVENVVKVFESAAGRVVALRGINLSIKKGKFVAIVCRLAAASPHS